MEAKVSARSNKKSAGGSGTAERKKSTKKKKKDKRKQSLQSLRGGESKESDVPSPDFDSEVQAEGDNSQTDQGEGQSTPAGQVTKLPLLGSQSNVSLIAQGVNASAASRYATLDKPSYAISTSSTTTATTRADLTAATTISTAAIATDSMEVTVSRVASLTVKRSSKGRGSKGGQSNKSGSSSNKSSRVRQGGGGGKGGANNSNASPSTTTTTTTFKSSNSVSSTSSSVSQNESLRWECILDDTEKERERIAVYKMNRRKRYLKAAQAKGLGWAMNYTTASFSPLSEDSGVDTGSGSSVKYVDFGTMQTLRPMASHRGLAEAFVEC